MKRLAALLLLAACGGSQHEVSAPPPPEREHRPCDPRGAEAARYVEPEALERELSRDEIALRGQCSEDQGGGNVLVPHRPDEVSRELFRQVTSSRRECNGACKPMEAALPEIDEQHDLEDETLQRECTTAAAKVDAKVRGGCQHVCLVERRKLASKAIFARTMHGLSAFADKVPAAPATDDEVRKMWIAANAPLPPRRFHFAIAPGKEMRAEGGFYPGGPPLRLRLAEGNAGCGQTQWTVEQW